MIRVFIISILALAALVVVTRNLPERPVPEPVEAAGADSSPAASDSPFSAFSGEWEGTLRAYRPDGALIRSLQVRQTHRAVSPDEQEVVISDRFADGSVHRLQATSVVVEGGLECRLVGPDGVEKLLEGRRSGDSLWWYRRDETAGVVESYRERIVPTGEGDLYTLDGVGVYGAGEDGDIVLYEGRYRRATRATE